MRARDVQILFADASTGANSPALVRQGQISELIGAKPQNRRRILEEAAGVTGLHGRRHEAELRVGAAAANLERLDDLARELESSLTRLKREARQAARYKALAAEIRALQASLLQQKWAEARAVFVRASAEAGGAESELEAAVRAAAAGSTRALAADHALKPLREADTAAAAMLARLAVERDRLDRDLELADAETRRLETALTRMCEDDAREAEREGDAAAALSRVESEAAELRSVSWRRLERAPAPEAAAHYARDRPARRRRPMVEAATAGLAAAQAEARATRERLTGAEARAARANTSLAETVAELADLSAQPDSGDEASATALTAVAERLARARAALEAAEAARAQAQAAESLARQSARAAEDELAGVATEAKALARPVQAPADHAFAPALDSVAPDAGLEAALAAAFGDDLEAALDAAAPTHWAGAKAPAPPAWPKGAEALADRAGAPPALAARLAFTALVEAGDGPKLRAALPPGARLVSRQGDLWRWDGFVARAGAPRPAQARLEHKARLAALWKPGWLNCGRRARWPAPPRRKPRARSRTPRRGCARRGLYPPPPRPPSRPRRARPANRASRESFDRREALSRLLADQAPPAQSAEATEAARGGTAARVPTFFHAGAVDDGLVAGLEVAARRPPLRAEARARPPRRPAWPSIPKHAAASAKAEARRLDLLKPPRPETGAAGAKRRGRAASDLSRRARGDDRGAGGGAKPPRSRSRTVARACWTNSPPPRRADPRLATPWPAARRRAPNWTGRRRPRTAAPGTPARPAPASPPGSTRRASV